MIATNQARTFEPRRAAGLDVVRPQRTAAAPDVRVRAGRPVKLYRAVHDAWFVSFEVLPCADLEETFLELHVAHARALARAAARALRDSAWSGYRIERDGEGRLWMRGVRADGAAFDGTGGAAGPTDAMVELRLNQDRRAAQAPMAPPIALRERLDVGRGEQIGGLFLDVLAHEERGDLATHRLEGSKTPRTPHQFGNRVVPRLDGRVVDLLPGADRIDCALRVQRALDRGREVRRGREADPGEELVESPGVPRGLDRAAAVAVGAGSPGPPDASGGPRSPPPRVPAGRR